MRFNAVQAVHNKHRIDAPKPSNEQSHPGWLVLRLLAVRGRSAGTRMPCIVQALTIVDFCPPLTACFCCMLHRRRFERVR